MWILLMMVDKHVHFHVLPRYSEPKTLGDVEFTDPGWPKHADMQNLAKLTDDQFDALKQHIKDCW